MKNIARVHGERDEHDWVEREGREREMKNIARVHEERDEDD